MYLQLIMSSSPNCASNNSDSEVAFVALSRAISDKVAEFRLRFQQAHHMAHHSAICEQSILVTLLKGIRILCGIIATSIVLSSFVFAQGKIQLKRPGAAPADSGGNPPDEVSLSKPAEEKIKLTRSDAAPSAAQETDYSTSRGPESRPRTIYLGPYLGFNVGGAANGFASSQNANGWDIYPILGLRSELYFKRVYGIITDLGYEQNKTYLKETPTGGYAGDGLLRTDYLTIRSMFSYRYSLYKVLGKVKFLRPVADALKPFAGNLQAGFFAKTPLSAQLELLGGTVGDPNDPLTMQSSLHGPFRADLWLVWALSCVWAHIFSFLKASTSGACSILMTAYKAVFLTPTSFLTRDYTSVQA
ncbi:MAG: hypothetical protein U1F40_08760 [Turneriella sp.]